MMAGNPSWWSMHSNMSPHLASDHHDHDHDHDDHHHHGEEEEVAIVSNNASLLAVHHDEYHIHGSSSSPSSSSLLPFSPLVDHHAQDFPHSWSQLLLGGLASEQEERFSPSQFESTRVVSSVDEVKQEVNSRSNNNNNKKNNNLYIGNQYHEEEQEGISSRAAAWNQIMPASSPKSCVTSLSSNNNNHNINNNNNSILDFSTNKRSVQTESHHQHADHCNSECNSSATGSVPKKPRVQSSSNPPLKVRKEKLGDRITSLHQLVSPFGKTDTASVLLEAIGYIRFLQGQIEALSSPYLGNNNVSAKNHHSVHGEKNCLFPDHPGQLLNASCMKRRGAANQQEGNQEAAKDLKSRGLCLVPISCTQLVGSDNGADYWAQSFGGGF